jgi:hypothetical protein
LVFENPAAKAQGTQRQVMKLETTHKNIVIPALAGTTGGFCVFYPVPALRPCG